MRTSARKFRWLLAGIFIILVGGTYSLVAFTPLRNTIPGYPDSESRYDAIRNKIAIDSLRNEIVLWDMHLANIRRIVTGEKPIGVDSLIALAAEKAAEPSKGNSASDSLLREDVRLQEQFTLSLHSRRIEQIVGLHFFRPVKGLITENYNQATGHPFIDIAAPEGTTVCSVLDGTVITAGWNDQTGYTIQVQHDNNLLSIYKHCGKLLRQSGDKVQAGTPIALSGNTGTLSTGSHLHFELWHNGEAIDPTLYIKF